VFRERRSCRVVIEDCEGQSNAHHQRSESSENGGVLARFNAAASVSIVAVSHAQHRLQVADLLQKCDVLMIKVLICGSQLLDLLGFVFLLNHYHTCASKSQTHFSLLTWKNSNTDRSCSSNNTHSNVVLLSIYLPTHQQY